MNRSTLPYLPIYPADILSDHRYAVLEPDEFGALFRLAFCQWQAEGALPSSETSLRRMAGVRQSKAWRRIWNAIHGFFNETEPGYIENPEVCELYARQMEKAGKASNKSRKASYARWHRHAPSNAQAVPIEEKKTTEQYQHTQSRDDSSAIPANATAFGSAIRRTCRNLQLPKPNGNNPELEPTADEVDEASRLLETKSIPQQIRIIASAGSSEHGLTDSLEKLIGQSTAHPNEVHRLLCEVYAKKQKNAWGIEMTRKVMTARLRSLLEMVDSQRPSSNVSR